MIVFQYIILAVIAIGCFIFVDFPGVKILVSAVAVLITSSAIYTKLVEMNLYINRETDSYKVFAGIPEPNSIIISNKHILPIHVLELMDNADLNVATSQRFSFLFSAPAKTDTRVEYPLIGKKRGKFIVGPTEVKYSDIFGMFSFDYELDTKREVVVFPNVFRFLSIGFRSLQPQGEIKNYVPIFEDPSIVTGLREYQQGDDTKKINWKLSAKHDKFLVDTNQYTISNGSLVLLNLFEGSYQFREKLLYVERAIDTTATLLRELNVMRQDIGLMSNCRVDNEDRIINVPLYKSSGHFITMMSELAVVDTSRTMTQKDIFDKIRNLRWGICIFLITTSMDDTTIQRLIELQRGGHSITIINVGPEIRKDYSLWSIGFQSFFADQQSGIINLIRV